MGYQNLSFEISDKGASFYRDGALVVLVVYLGRPGKTEYGKDGGNQRWVVERVAKNNLERVAAGYGCFDTMLGIALLATADPNYKYKGD